MQNRLNTLSLALVAVVLIIGGCLRNSGNIKEDNAIKAPVIDTSSYLLGTDQQGKTSPDELMESGLKGRWQRTDGDYYLQIFSVLSDSTLKAGYYNPNTINVEKSEWTIQEGILFLRVILRDVNYPGSTYILSYDPEYDLLTGKYYQAVEGINYDVVFARVN
ncbi:MAG: hypothetical protein IH592_14615 [Bacteroidales bacterium]|nr:hypothetical protein [Bacteroidales bacterium]